MNKSLLGMALYRSRYVVLRNCEHPRAMLCSTCGSPQHFGMQSLSEKLRAIGLLTVSSYVGVFEAVVHYAPVHTHLPVFTTVIYNFPPGGRAKTLHFLIFCVACHV